MRVTAPRSVSGAGLLRSNAPEGGVWVWAWAAVRGGWYGAAGVNRF